MTPVNDERITADPGTMAGVPHIRDTRVTVTAVLGQLAAGSTIDQIVGDHPCVERADVIAALQFAAVVLQERDLWRVVEAGRARRAEGLRSLQRIAEEGGFDFARLGG